MSSSTRSLTLACNISSRPRLPIEVSVSGCRSPRVSRRASSASRHSGSAAARSHLAFTSSLSLQMEVSVLGCRLPRVSRRASSASRHSGSAAARSPWSFSSSLRLLME
eukprot:scaffold85445_cov66-Phaeocystis_antarctica.AAC.2